MVYEATVKRRLAFLECDDRSISSLERVRKAFAEDLDAMLDRFYEHILQQPDLKAMFPNDEAVQRARSAQKRYWLRFLFSGDVREARFDEAQRIGASHVRVGLTPEWYLGGYCHMLNQIVGLAGEHYENDSPAMAEIVQALNKQVFLDMILVIDAYIEAKNSTIKNVLVRATQFTDDVQGLIVQLEGAQQELETEVDALISASGSAQERAAQLSEAGHTDQSTRAEAIGLAEATDGVAAIASRLNGASTRLSELTASMRARLNQLMFHDRLYTQEHSGEGFLKRVKALIGKHF